MADLERIFLRLDKHIERQDIHLKRQDEHMERQDAHMKRQDEHMERQDHLMARNTKAFEGLMDVIESAKIALLDLQDEARSQTQAILRVIDRLDGKAT